MIDTFTCQVPIKIIVSSTQIHDKTMNSINGQWIRNSNKNLSEWLADKYNFDGDHIYLKMGFNKLWVAAS